VHHAGFKITKAPLRITFVKPGGSQPSKGDAYRIWLQSVRLYDWSSPSPRTRPKKIQTHHKLKAIGPEFAAALARYSIVISTIVANRRVTLALRRARSGFHPLPLNCVCDVVVVVWCLAFARRYRQPSAVLR
jgi:hypothetical protein